MILEITRFKMADISEVKRSNFAILLNNSRTLWPIDVKFSGVMDMGTKMIPMDIKQNTSKAFRPLSLVLFDIETYTILFMQFDITDNSKNRQYWNQYNII